ncbi:RNA polymerase ECF-type sigma factor [Flavobacterium psychrophilum]|nr:RNA polymerase ECF-type sigma factor [Flavobacterium psychrophilum]SNB08110.1 RNA polymerase ECF-type sigma factor [Flavobacterium psychrophilum]
MINENVLIACKKMHRDAQRQVYEQMAPKLYRTCKRYLKKEEEIEEVLADTFYTIFIKIDMLKELGAFEAWARKIAVNNCLYQLKHKVNFNIYLEDTKLQLQPESLPNTHLEEEDLLKLLDYIPAGCKTIFNLFAIEGYSHKEIAMLLNISEGTSKSQLNVARTKLKDLVNNLYYKQAK